jgi:hypothetical protein
MMASGIEKLMRASCYILISVSIDRNSDAVQKTLNDFPPYSHNFTDPLLRGSSEGEDSLSTKEFQEAEVQPTWNGAGNASSPATGPGCGEAEV